MEAATSDRLRDLCRVVDVLYLSVQQKLFWIRCSLFAKTKPTRLRDLCRFTIVCWLSRFTVLCVLVYMLFICVLGHCCCMCTCCWFTRSIVCYWLYVCLFILCDVFVVIVRQLCIV